MKKRIWIDGNNFFNLWEPTRRFVELERAITMQNKMNRCIKVLAEYLDWRRDGVLVFLDGGLEKSVHQLHGIRIHQCGNGGSADDHIIRELEKALRASRITVITCDHPLQDRVQACGAKCLTVPQYVETLMPIHSTTAPNWKLNSLKTAAKRL